MGTIIGSYGWELHERQKIEMENIQEGVKDQWKETDCVRKTHGILNLEQAKDKQTYVYAYRV